MSTENKLLIVIIIPVIRIIIQNKTLLHLSEPGIRYRLEGPISDYKSVDVPQKAIAQSSRKFSPIPQNSNCRLTEGGIARGKTRAIRKWELNTCDNFVNLGTGGFFVDRHRSKLYTRRKFYQKYNSSIEYIQ